ncbi:DUF2272 domain-containing protein [Thermomonas sp. HDW16]|uniref:DUF2272 domain-containing protein n=1 Tax=Thermomonas sp. HDW16 TaxID=2714945 RepID=UPI0014078938|nr:DUF2272 domain-containing protein [Thermomonas sp. HDW16]QIL20609.1 DUF2272 domain-containing protein [Thermomonas sp. HDW16]
MRFPHWLIGLCLLAFAGTTFAADQCPLLRGRQSDPEVATRIAAAACDEHLRWQRPFITTDGRLASSAIAEGESRGLQGGGAPWRQVAMYWRDAGLLGQTGASGANDCSYALANASYPGMGCRGFVIDSPWSAAFVSWVMRRSGVPRFTFSGSHFDYVRAARLDPAGSPYEYLEPMSATPAIGDLLCYVRTGRVYGYQALASAIDGGANGLPMHCDIVVAANPGGDAKAYLVGGNVQQAVTMRVLNLNAGGRFWNLPRRTDGDVECSPDTQAACDFNRQDWSVLLKLKPQSALAQLGPVQPPSFMPDVAPQQTCCVNCVVGSGIPRCPATDAAQPQPWGLPQDSD